MPGRGATYSLLPLRLNKAVTATMEEKKGLELGYLPKRTLADEIAHEVLDNSVKKYKQAQRFQSVKRLPKCVFLAAAGAALVALCILVIVLVVVLVVLRSSPSPISIAGLLTVPAAGGDGDGDGRARAGGVVSLHYNKSDPATYKPLVDELRLTWMKYERRGTMRHACNGTAGGSGSASSCTPRFADRFDLEALRTHCSDDPNFGYEAGRPCLLLVLRVPPDWDAERCLVPVMVNSTTPESVLTTIVPVSTPTSTPTLADIRVTCTSADNRTVQLPVVKPSMGFARAVLQQRHLRGYMDPLVMLQFNMGTYSVQCSVCPGYAYPGDVSANRYQVVIDIDIKSN